MPCANRPRSVSTNCCRNCATPGTRVPCAAAGIGGRIMVDTAKAVANLFTNPGPAATYQGWDLVKNPGHPLFMRSFSPVSGFVMTHVGLDSAPVATRCR